MKSRSAIKIGVLLLLVIILLFIGLVGFPVGIYDVLPFGHQVLEGPDVAQGTIVTFTPASTTEATGEELDALLNDTVVAMRSRLLAFGYDEATISRVNETEIQVVLPVGSRSMVKNATQMISDISTRAELEVLDYEGNAVFDGSMVDSYSVYTGSSGILSNDSSTVYLTVKLDAEGTELLKENIYQNVGRQYTVKLDGTTLNTDLQGFLISDGVYNISGFASEEKAEQVGRQLISGTLPLTLATGSTYVSTAYQGENLLTSISTAVVIAFFLIAILLVLFYRLPGLVSAFTIGLYMLLAMFALALFGAQVSYPMMGGLLLTLLTTVVFTVVGCMMLKKEMQTSGVFPVSVKYVYDGLLKRFIDACVALFIMAFVLLCFYDTLLKAFGIGLLIGVVLSFAVSVFVPRFLLPNLMGLGLNKTCLYGVKEVRES
ncbi:MAG: hypothetical protein ACOYI4_05575 [Christensenellales bacterium]|jgi:preprotein translocase subunit SecD